MPYTSRCPACDEYVTVPDGLASDSPVRCPACEEEYLLSEVGDPVADAPDSAAELVPVATPDTEMPMLDIWKQPREVVDDAPAIEVGSVLRRPAPKKASPKKKQNEANRDETRPEPVISFEGLRQDETTDQRSETGEPVSGAVESPGTEERSEEPETTENAEPEVADLSGAEENRTDPAPVADQAEDDSFEAESPPEAEAPAAETDALERAPESEVVPSEADTFPAEPSTDAADGSDREETRSAEVGAPLPPDPDLLVRCPHCEAESRLTELILASNGERISLEALAVVLGARGYSASPEPEGDEVSHAVETAPDVESDHGDHAERFSFSSVAGETSNGTAATGVRRTKKQKSLAKEMIGAAFGALLAIPIAYYILNLVAGERWDKVPVPLPFCPHTYDHLPSEWPAWWPAWARVSAPSAEAVPQVEEEVPETPATEDPDIQEAFRRLDEARQAAAATTPPSAQPKKRAESPKSAAGRAEAAAVDEAAKPARQPSRQEPAARKSPDETAPAEESSAKMEPTPEVVAKDTEETTTEKPPAGKAPAEKPPAKAPAAEESTPENPATPGDSGEEAKPTQSDGDQPQRSAEARGSESAPPETATTPDLKD